MQNNLKDDYYPLVSIITPTYNHKKFIEHTIKSVIKQTYPNWEMFIVDDFSSDRTEAIALHYTRADNRIKYLKHENNYGIGNLSESYNDALNLSRGELLAILEGDDLWPENKLEKQIPCFRENKVVLAWGKGVIVNFEGESIGIVPFPKINNKLRNIYENRPVGYALNKLLLTNFIIPAVSVMVRKEAILGIGGFQQIPGTCFTDYPTWLELSTKGEFRFCEDVTGYWRVHAQQTTSQFPKKFFIDTANISKNFLDKNAGKQNYLFLNKKIIIAHNYWLIGQYKLSAGESAEARKYFWKTVVEGSYSLKIRGLLGIISSFLNIDITNVEKFLKFFKKIHYTISNKITYRT